MRTPNLGKRFLASITILTIAGTLSACGRYGRPIRPAALPASAEETLGEKIDEGAEDTDARVDDRVDESEDEAVGRAGLREGREDDASHTGVPTK